jgi:DNA helicase-2/ATP-dependent DNA helicase PcrA
MMEVTERTHSFFDHLNDKQKEAVQTVEGPLLVLAGAGTGKTRVLTSRIAHILGEQKAWPSQILSVTFTNKAALEMKERVSQMTNQDLRGLWLGTFHSIGARILRRHANLVGLEESFTIIDPDDQLRVLKQILEAEGMDHKKQDTKTYAYMINTWKDRGWRPEQVSKTAVIDAALDLDKSVSIYAQYQERLRVVNAADFGDLLLHTLTIFQNYPEVLAQYQSQFKYILVDEYQDTNIVQYLWLRLLAQTHQNLCVVGDDDQSIYRWRGAEVGNILRFEKDFPGAKIIRLEQNYRSTGHILGAASGLIENNKGRLGKTLWTDAGDGERVLVKGLRDGREEARWIGETIEEYHRQKISYNDIAILVRAGFQTREFEESFMSLAIPYRIIGGLRFYERQEIRDALAYLRLIMQPNDDLALERILNVPKRGIGKATMQKFHTIARHNRAPLFHVIKSFLETDEIKGKTRLALLTFVQNIERWQTLLKTLPHDEVTMMVLDESGYTDMWQKDKSIESTGRLENLKEFVSAIREFEDLPTFLEHVSLVMDTATTASEENVTVMTMHSAKGLEHEIVFLPGWEEGIFPGQKSLLGGGTEEVEEERRLGYVGITRAKKQACITFAGNRYVYGEWQPSIPSRFITELPPKHTLFLEGGFQRSNRFPATHKPQAVAFERQTLFKKGDRVFHLKFGYGRVQETDQDKVTVNFDHTGIKKVMEGFLKGV